MPLGLEDWTGAQMPAMFGATEGGAPVSNPATEQAGSEQANGIQAQEPTAREYTVNGKRK